MTLLVTLLVLLATTSPGTGKPYGLARVCRVLEFPRSTIYAQQARETAKVMPLHPPRRGPKPQMADADLLAAIRADLKASPFVGEGHRKVWARLRILSGIRVKARAIHGRLLRNLDEVRQVATAFRDRYNRHWRLEKLG
jgi:hypothetical protein